MSGDICDEEVMKKIIDKTVQQFGRLDVLVSFTPLRDLKGL